MGGTFAFLCGTAFTVAQRVVNFVTKGFLFNELPQLRRKFTDKLHNY